MASPQEPPVVPSMIPFIGHLVWFMRDKFNYLVQLSHKYPLPIFTINMAGQKMYVITDANLMQATQKLSKALSFLPIEAKAALRICGVSTESVRIYYHTSDETEGETAILKETHIARRASLSPSSQFDKLNQELVQNLQASLDSIKSLNTEPVRIGLSAWLRRHVTSAVTSSMYGPQNPFKDESVVEGVWKINKSITPLLLGVFTSFTASNGLAGRATVAKAFEHYFQDGGHELGSTSTKDRYEIAIKHGIRLEDIAKFEVGEAIAILTNTAPACFWAIFFIYATPGILSEIRQSLDSTFSENDKDRGTGRDFNIENIKERCPLLVSTVSETLRYCSLGGSVRQVTEDTVLDGRWLLKKGGIVQMPSRILHKDPSSWGDDVDDFNPRRFMKDSKSSPKHAANFRPFGGGTTICPGRHFATNTILAIAALFVRHYDLKPTAEAWVVPSAENTALSEFMMEPDVDVEVEVLPRNDL